MSTARGTVAEAANLARVNRDGHRCMCGTGALFGRCPELFADLPDSPPRAIQPGARDVRADPGGGWFGKIGFARKSIFAPVIEAARPPCCEVLDLRNSTHRLQPNPT
jgi:hypothetical protein